MRIIRDNHDHNDENEPDEGRVPTEPKAIGDILGDEFEDYLKDVIAAADNPPPDHWPPPAETGQPQRPALRLVKTDTDVTDPVLTATDSEARGRTIRRSAGASSFVVALAVTAGWGEPFLVAGPIGAYGAGWLAYLWWNAALRPSIPQVLTTVTSGIGHAVAAIATAIVAVFRALLTGIDTARTRHETNRTAQASPSL
ncbi:hypothetical protein ACFQZZ_14925 [Nocardia sp. GCM10030253]|uniref:hypothetical protein n=1 Tax=Nocardia sp. GCM10030253 TaxID=3273404 RepID=UPI003639A401